MNINGAIKPFSEMRISDIGRILIEESANKDGDGLTVQITKLEEIIFEAHFGTQIGFELCNLMKSELSKSGKTVNFRYTYRDRVLRTIKI